MASSVVSQQDRAGDLVPIEGKQKKNLNIAEGRNRPALGDIGNVVQLLCNPPITRRITRNFGAQLLRNAQVAAAENNKKLNCVNLDEVANKKVPKQKKVVAVKSRPVEVIEISPDTHERIKDVVVNKKKHTLSSVLTARSKYACGISNKPKESITDIDAADAENDLAAVEYVEDMYNFYKQTENESQPHDYIDSQPEINEQMRAILMDWLIEVHHKFDLTPETLYLTFNIIDRFLAKKTVARKQLQLVGISAMHTASKYEEIWAPEVNDLVCIADSAYTHEQILAMEKTILCHLEWTLTVPTHYVFLVRFIKASLPDQEMENLVYFLAELGMINYTTIRYCPSMVAASAVYVARCTLNKTPFWNSTLQLHTGFSESQLIQCARILVSFHQMAAESNLKAVQRKYSNTEKSAVALLPPAKI